MSMGFMGLAYRGMSHRSLRSWLTILGIVIGIVLVVTILALSGGIKDAVSSSLRMFGTQLLVIFPGKETNPLVGLLGGERFRDADVAPLADIPGVRAVIPEDSASVSADFDGETKTVLLHAASWAGMRQALEQMQGFKLQEGRWPAREDDPEVVIGDLTAHSLFKGRIRIGDTITVKARRLTVVGIFAPIGEQLSDNLVFVSLEMFRQLTNTTGVRSINIMATPDANLDLLALRVRSQMSKQDAVREFSVLTPAKALRLVDDVLGIIETVLFIVSSVSLLVGGVGIMNTMFTSVIERTKQIGVMKAVGASSDDIMTLFLIESGFIGLVGGVAGVIAGIIVAFFVGLAVGAAGIPGLFSPGSIRPFDIVALLVLTFLLGVIAGVSPARRAGNLEPAEALRYE